MKSIANYFSLLFAPEDEKQILKKKKKNTLDDHLLLISCYRFFAHDSYACHNNNVKKNHKKSEAQNLSVCLQKLVILKATQHYKSGTVLNQMSIEG